MLCFSSVTHMVGRKEQLNPYTRPNALLLRKHRHSVVAVGIAFRCTIFRIEYFGCKTLPSFSEPPLQTRCSSSLPTDVHQTMQCMSYRKKGFVSFFLSLFRLPPFIIPLLLPLPSAFNTISVSFSSPFGPPSYDVCA